MHEYKERKKIKMVCNNLDRTLHISALTRQHKKRHFVIVWQTAGHRGDHFICRIYPIQKEIIKNKIRRKKESKRKYYLFIDKKIRQLTEIRLFLK